MIRLVLALSAAASLALVSAMAADAPGRRAVEAGGPEDIASNEELSEIVLRLEDSKTEMDALRRLIKFSGMFLYSGGSTVWVTGDPKRDELRRSAVRTLGAHSNPGTVRRALDDDDPDVRFWGVMSFESLHGKGEPWASLLPRLEEIAVHDENVGTRTQAIERLRCYEQAAAFLATLRQSTNETDPGVLMRLLRFSESRAEWNVRAVGFLSGKDEALRLKWVSYIWLNVWNPSTAPMWRIKGDPKLIESLRQLELTGPEKAREYARKTLQVLGTEYETDPQLRGVVDGSHSVHSETNRPSGTAGPGR